jgi:hypothetical protein
MRFTEYLQIVTIALHTLYNSLQHALSLLSLLYLHRLSPGNGFQRRSFLSFRVHVLTDRRVSDNYQVKSSQSHIATDSQSVSKSWCRAPSGAYDQIFITVWQLRFCLLWGALSDERAGLSFVRVIACFSKSFFNVKDVYILHVYIYI